MRRYSVDEVASKTGMPKVVVKRIFGDQKTASASEIAGFSPPGYDNAKILAEIASRDIRVLWACKIADHCFKSAKANNEEIKPESMAAVEAAKQYIVGGMGKQELGQINSDALAALVTRMDDKDGKAERLARIAYHASECALAATDETSAYSAWCVLTTASGGEAFDKRWVNELVQMMEL